jgi:DNA repair protein RadC
VLAVTKPRFSPCRKLSYNEHSSHEHTHFHPSGDPTPSPEDIEATRQLVEAGRILDIELVDHIIIGHQRFVSLKEHLRWE